MPTATACSWSRRSGHGRPCRRAGHAPRAAAGAEAGLPQRLLDVAPGEATARRGGARRDRHGPADRRRVATEFAVAFYQALTTGSSGENRKITGGLQPGKGLRAGRGFVKAATGEARGPRRRGARPVAYRRWASPGRSSSQGSEHVGVEPLRRRSAVWPAELPDDIGWPDEPSAAWNGSAARTPASSSAAAGRSASSTTWSRPGHAGGRVLSSTARPAWASSVLDAGLLPRLEPAYRVGYLRRSAELGLLGTLRQALAPARRAVRPRAGLVARRRAGGARSRRASTRPRRRTRGRSPEEAGRRGRRPGAREIDPGAEVAELWRALAAAFDPAPARERPRGKLILSFRKEWLDEFATACKAAGLDCETGPALPLDRAGVAEAIRGPRRGAVPEPQVKPGTT